MKVASVEEMIQIEQEAIVKVGTSICELMENAGRAIAEEAAKVVQKGSNVIIICGKGNNGGDGFVAARYLHQQGFKPIVFHLFPNDELSEDAKEAFFKLRKTSVEVILLGSDNLDDLAAALSSTSLIIDAIFGFNLKGAVKGIAKDAIKIINEAECPVLSVDVPSGLESDTGHVHGVCVKASKTVSFTCPKLGLVTYPGAEMVGELVIVDIGIMPEIVDRLCKVQLVDLPDPLLEMPQRASDVHKKSVGQVLIVAGSIGMTGAAVLTAKAALRSGSGVVTLGAPSSVNGILEGKLTEVLTHPLAETSEHAVDESAYDEIMKLSESFDVVAVGPGISRNKRTALLICKLVSNLECPLIIDADGLNALVGKTNLLAKRTSPTVITPHPGELGRLLDLSSEEIQNDRLGITRRVAEEWDIVVVLKGARSIVCSPQEEAIIASGNPGMATAGTGDVLTGIISGFIAQGLDPYQAALLGTYLHGLSGDMAAEDLTEWCLVASDLIDYLPWAIKALISENATAHN